MWFERFVIIVTSLHRDFLPSSWASYTPDVDRSRHAASAASGCSSRCFLLFCRFVPVIAMAEVKGVAPVHRTAQRSTACRMEGRMSRRVLIGVFDARGRHPRAPPTRRAQQRP